MKMSVDIVDLNVKTKPNDRDNEVKKKQGDVILAYIEKMGSGTAIIAMDERGKTYDSPEFSHHLNTLSVQGFSSLCFVVGGAFGLSNEVLSKCPYKLSLGKMVWPHRLIPLMLMEQLYRAQQINAGHPYHKA